MILKADFPIRFSSSEVILQTSEDWVLTVNRMGNRQFYALLHMCSNTIEADSYHDGLVESSDDGNCIYCKDKCPSKLFTMYNLFREE